MNYITIDSKRVPIEGEKNVLSLIRKIGIDLPTFCYHSELSIYGACRMCVVEDERGNIFAKTWNGNLYQYKTCSGIQKNDY